MSRLFSNLIIRTTFIALTGAIIIGVGVVTLNENPKHGVALVKNENTELSNASPEHNEPDQININSSNTAQDVVDDETDNDNQKSEVLIKEFKSNSNTEQKDEPTEKVVAKPLVTYNTVVRKSIIEFGVVTQNDASVEVGKSYVKNEGANGERTTTVKQEFHDGKLINEVVINDETTKSPVDKVVIKGTKEVSSNIIERRDLVMESFNSQNEYRVSKGLNALKWNETLYQNALVRSKEITHTWSHTRPNGATPFTAITVSYRTAGENIALTSSQGSNLGLRFTQMWINSEPHRLSIVKAEFTSAAVSIVEIDGILYATTLFIG